MKKKHDYKNILLLISGGIIIYLLKNKYAKSKQVLIQDASDIYSPKSSHMDTNIVANSEYQYSTTIYGDEQIKGNFIKKDGDFSIVDIRTYVPSQRIKINGIPLIY